MDLQITGGSVRGKDHVIAGKNNQDAFVIRKTPDVTAAIVCDGCGSGSHSEVGAKLAAEYLSNLLMSFSLVKEDYFNLHLISAKHDLEDYLKDTFYREYGDRAYEIVNSYSLFTLLGVLINNDIAAFFSIGDGYFIINGETKRLGPFPNNAPPYIGYNLLPRREKYIQFDVSIMPISDLKSFIIATDGFEDLIEAENLSHPTIKDRNVGNISQFWEEDKYFQNSYTLGRQLNLLAGGVPRLINVGEEKFFATRNGIFRDDTTFVVGRIKDDEDASS